MTDSTPRSRFAEVAGITQREWDVVKRAALAIAPLFEAQGWQWWTGNPDDYDDKAVPDVFRIAETLCRLLARAKESETGTCSSGRLSVEWYAEEYLSEREYGIHISVEMADVVVDELTFDAYEPNPVYIEQIIAAEEAVENAPA